MPLLGSTRANNAPRRCQTPVRSLGILPGTVAMGDNEAPEIRLFGDDNKFDPIWDEFIQHAVSKDLISDLEVGSDGSVACSTPQFFNCTFSSEKVLREFELRPEGNFTDGNSLIMGLNVPGGSNITTIRLLDAFGVDIARLPQPLRTIASILENEVDGILPTFSIHNATTGTKNGSWIIILDESALEISTALSLEVNPFSSGEIDFGAAAQALQDLVGLKVDLSKLKFSTQNLPRFRLKHKAVIIKSLGSLSITSLSEATFELPVPGFIINLKAGSNGLLSASLLSNGGSIGSMLEMLVDPPDQSDTEPKGQDGIFLDDTINLWKVIVQLPGASEFSGSNITYDIGFILTIPLPGLNVKIALSYNSDLRTFTGHLLTKEMFLSRLNPNFNDLEDLGPGMLADLEDFYDIKDSPQLRGLPDNVPTRLARAVITYTKSSADIPYELSFSAAMASQVTPSGSNDVPFPFAWTGITLNYLRQGGAQSVNSLFLSSTFELDSQSGKFQAGHMNVEFAYQDANGIKTWALNGSARYIQLGAIIEFFDPNLQNEVAEVLGKLSIDQLDVSYTYSGNKASSFLFSGLVSLGDINLMLYYQYATKTILNDTNGKTAADQKIGQNPNLKPLRSGEVLANAESAWRFDAYLDAGSSGSTIGTIADSILDNASDSIPSFIRNIRVAPDDPTAHLITLHAGKSSKTGPSETVEHIVFLLKVEILDVEFTFEQVSKSRKVIPGSITKRLLRVSAGKLPLLRELPVVKELPQPWQKLQYMWSPEAGLTRDEVALINEKLQIEAPDNKLYFKPATRDAMNPTVGIDPVVLVEGHHFIVVANDKAILDHIFKPDVNKNTPNKNDEKPENASLAASIVSSNAELTDEETPPSKGALKKTSQFLDISGVSLQFKKGSLWIFVDATVRLGPIEFSLIDFGIGFDISDLEINKLNDVLGRIQFQLAGMEVLFNKPPILISGAFYHNVVEADGKRVESYRGGISLGIPPYKFIAVGEYAVVQITVPEKKEFKSVFIFAKLDGPIIDFAFATLRGLRVGFGYNSIIRSPALEELYMFPLIASDAAGGAGSSPIAILDAMRGGSNPFVQLKDESFWLAFGFSISSFNIITATACAVVSFSDAGPIFAIYGSLVCAFPPESPSPQARLFYIEVLMSAELNFVEDCFKVQAALAPTSFVYVPFCRLEGGMALYTFFGRNPHAGDWVFTVGGYHRAFQVPAHYPRAARLAVNFNIDIIRIRGECYFAITPKAVMTGALIKCELEIGPVFAWLAAAFDAMVQFSPLHYWVSMSVEVGVECDIPLLFATIHIRIHVGARLEIEGPEFGGTAYVDFWFFSFSFDFGARPIGPPPISLDEFYELCEKAGPPDDSPQATPQDGFHARLKFSIEDGVFNMPSKDEKPEKELQPLKGTGAGSKWYIKGGSFRFRISSVFALTGAFLETEESAKRDQAGNTILLGEQKTVDMDAVNEPSLAPSKLHSLPMQVHAEPENIQPDVAPAKDGITSKLCIAIQDIDVKGRTMEGFKPSFVYKPMPLTLWADPRNPPNRLSKEKGTVDLPMSVVLQAPDPVLATSKIPQFNATDMAKLCAGSNKIPGIPLVVQDTLLPDEVEETTQTATEKWDTMASKWQSSSETNLELANNLTQLCMQALGWNKPPVDVEEKAEKEGIEPWKLPVAFPRRLVAGTDREEFGVEDGLDSFYLELPRTTVATL
ncbi:hypothetical protein CC78DRAFT_597881 [Lojkania enalia]|uniref:DUF6603 domain-containing protein n=1 Tax=Lojkania enalia TaxID=147567 RepID=A0A9P4JWI2_9PLEO|nr:hypothetical protein CC78DRAFT_597881 [Didymosphaeria enalia]